MLDKNELENIFKQYPKLENFIDAGTIGLKMAREILDVDRWYMYELFKKLVVIGAVKSMGNNSWRATPELREYLRERRNKIKEEV